MLFLSAIITLPLALCGAPLPSLQFNLLLVLPDATVAANNASGSQFPPKQSWQIRDEVLSGAEIALRDINEALPFQLTVTELPTESCSSPLALVQFVRKLTSTAGGGNVTNVAVIGAFCKAVFRELIGIASHERIGLTQIALTTSPAAVDGRNSLHYQMLPSMTTYAEALADFMTHVGWTRIAVVIGQTQDAYYLKMSEQIIKTLKEKGFQTFFSTEVDVSTEQTYLHSNHNNIYNVVRFVQNSGSKIVYILLPPKEASLLLCLAYNYGLQWPEYGWIVPDVSLEDVLTFCSFGNCSQNAIEGVISFKKNETNSSTTVTGKSYETYLQEYNELLSSKPEITTEASKSNIYANALHDSIWAVALSLNTSLSEVRDYLVLTEQRNETYFKLVTQKRVSQIVGRKLANISFPGLLGHISFDSEHQTQLPITLYQIIDGQYKKLGIYKPDENRTYYENYPPSRIPSDKLDRVYILLPAPVGALLMVGLVACTLLTILNTFLFVFYRKEREIKATSFSLSMIIFLGCYLMYTGTGVHIIVNGRPFHDNVVCLAEIWTIYVGTDLTFSTILVKVCRIHHIFNFFGKVGKICSDQSLLLLIILPVLGKVVLLSVWTAVDLFRITDSETYHPEGKPPFYEVVQHCRSRHTTIWTGIAILYTMVIACILAIVSFKTRKIKRKDFKDTKKINAFISTTIMATLIFVTLWFILRTIGYPNISKTLVTIVFLLIPLCCQVYLFSPKTLPPLKRSLGKYWCVKNCKRKPLDIDRSCNNDSQFLRQTGSTQLSFTLPTRVSFTLPSRL